MLKRLLAQTYLHPLRRRLQKEPYYRFKSVQELQLAASWGIRIDANTASIDEWLRLPSLSIHQARRLTRLTSSRIFFNGIEDVAAALDITRQQAQAWDVILLFCYYDAAQSLEPLAIDVNAATLAELMSVPTIDSSLANEIIASRRTSQYQDLSDLQQRLQLNPRAAAELLHYLSFAPN